jgi:acyl-CoA thioester hydrolase
VPPVHRHSIRVYYEDTDLAGIVYYANYLKFIERGRSEWVREMEIDQTEMRDALGIVFAVRRVEADYLKPATFGDDLIVTTSLVRQTAARIVLDQQVLRDDEVLFSSIVTLFCLKNDGSPARVPLAFRDAAGDMAK